MNDKDTMNSADSVLPERCHNFMRTKETKMIRLSVLI